MIEKIEKKDEKNKSIIKKLEDLEQLLTDIKEELVKMNEQSNILDQYQKADSDEASAVKYYGYVKKNGDWLILRNDTANNTFRYAKSDDLWRKEESQKGYSDAWTNREKLQYFYFYEIF